MIIFFLFITHILIHVAFIMLHIFGMTFLPYIAVLKANLFLHFTNTHIYRGIEHNEFDCMYLSLSRTIHCV